LRLKLASVLVATSLLAPASLGAQGWDSPLPTLGGDGAGFVLGANYPNPFREETRIPFELAPLLFEEGRPALVSARVYNILRQWVATPVALAHPAGDGAPAVDLEYLTPGRHELLWDARDRSGGRAPSGVYILEITVNGRAEVRRIFLSQ